MKVLVFIISRYQVAKDVVGGRCNYVIRSHEYLQNELIKLVVNLLYVGC